MQKYYSWMFIHDGYVKNIIRFVFYARNKIKRGKFYVRSVISWRLYGDTLESQWPCIKLVFKVFLDRSGFWVCNMLLWMTPLARNEKAIYTINALLLGRGDNLQLLISPLLKYEGWLYNIIDDKNFEINSLEPPVQGVWRFHIPPWGPVEMQKMKILNFVLIVVKMCSNELKRTT